MTDDELVITVRIRLKPDDEPEVRLRQIDLAAGIGRSLFAAFQEHKVPGDLAGFEVALPTFEPIKAPTTTTGAP